MAALHHNGWSWKVEPVSPPPLMDLDADNWFNTGDYVLAGNDTIIVPDQIEVDKKPLTRAEQATRLLNDLDEWIKEEPFSDWYEEKIDLPIFEDLDTAPVPVRRGDYISTCGYDGGIQHQGKAHQIPPMVVQIPSQQPAVIPTQPIASVPQIGEQTTALMQEFELVLNNHETLTPPESPRDDGMGLTMLQDMRTAELDELVRSRVESLVECQESSCASSVHEDSAVDSPASSDSGYDDPDWMPEPLSEPKQLKRRRSSKPYSRSPPEEKRQRKKEQNKNAATRYRLKKKAEIEEILGEEKDLQDTNQKLKTDLSELAREIKYLKNLMREVFKAKGLIS